MTGGTANPGFIYILHLNRLIIKGFIILEFKNNEFWNTPYQE